MIKLLIVDDSALMRRQLMTLFQAEGLIRQRHCAWPVGAVRIVGDLPPAPPNQDLPGVTG